jgi:hypothetical protein
VQATAGFIAHPPGHANQHHRGRNGRDQSQNHPAHAILEERTGHIRPPVVDENVAKGNQALARGRQEGQQRGVAEKQGQQQRNVSEHLHVHGGQARHQPVTRYAGHADDDSEDRGQHDGQCGHEQGVQDAHGKSPAVSVRGGVRQQAVVDGQAALHGQEIEPRGDVARLQVGLGVVEQLQGHVEDSSDHQGLDQKSGQLFFQIGRVQDGWLPFGGVNKEPHRPIVPAGASCGFLSFRLVSG